MRHFFLFLLILHAGIVCAQQTPRNLLSGKYSSGDFRQVLLPFSQWKPYPVTGNEWRKLLPDSICKNIIRAGEAAAVRSIPEVPATLFLEYVRTGDRGRYEKASFERRSNLTDLILAEAVEDKGRFTDAILNYVWITCEETYWGIPAHIGTQKAGNGLPDLADPTVDLFAAETAGILALADYFTGEKLDKISPLIRKRIYQETERRIFKPMEQPSRYGYLSKTALVNNWNPWIVSNLLTAALLLERDESRRAARAYSYATFMDSYLNSLGDEGGCDEGPSYWFAAGACVFDVLELLKSASDGRIDIYQEPLIRNMASYIYKTHIADDYFVNFADADPTLKPDGLLLYAFGEAVEDPQLKAFGQWAYSRYPAALSNNGFHRMRRVNNLLYINRIDKNKGEFKPLPYTWQSDIQVLTGSSPGGFYMATHAGHNAESHNHNDVGDFILYHHGVPVIMDAGRGNYTARTFSSRRYELWFIRSEYHNLPVINGAGQEAGRKFEAVNVVRKADENEVSLTMDIAPAYAEKAALKSWKRIVNLKRKTSILEIQDDYVFSVRPDTLQQVFMTVCETNLSVPGKIAFLTARGEQVTLSYDPALWTVTSDLPSTEGMEYSSFKTKWGGSTIRRIILTARKTSVKGKHAFRFSVE